MGQVIRFPLPGYRHPAFWPMSGLNPNLGSPEWVKQTVPLIRSAVNVCRRDEFAVRELVETSDMDTAQEALKQLAFAAHEISQAAAVLAEAHRRLAHILDGPCPEEPYPA